MFEAITFRNSTRPGAFIDPGLLAEALLFYQRVIIVANTGTLKDLLRLVPPFIVLELLERRKLECYYLSDQVGVRSRQAAPGRTHHDLVKFSSPQHTIGTVAQRCFLEATAATAQARIGARRFERLLKPLDHGAFDQTYTFSELSEAGFVEPAVSAMLTAVAPEYVQPAPLRFRLHREKNGALVDTNIDFPALNDIYHKVVSKAHSSMSPAYILSVLQGIQEELFFASVLQSEIASDPLTAQIHAVRMNGLIQRRLESDAAISSFVELVLEDAHTIREAVNLGQVAFADIRRLIYGADKFRDWLARQPGDADLVRAYYKEVVRKTWVEKLPTKVSRWTFFTAAGVALDVLGGGGVGTALGVAVSAADMFLLEHILREWKPHHFVEGDLRTLFARQEDAPE